MIHYVAGDILHSSADLVAHGVAPNDPMSQGLALSLHQRYPAMHKDFHHWCHTSHAGPGSAWLWSGVDGVRIANLLTQEGGYEHGSKPGKASLGNVGKALKALRKIIDDEGIASVALPRLATGVGGLSWDDVKPLVEERLGDLELPVYVYEEYHAGQKAREL